MRTTFSTTFYCRRSKMNKQGLAPIEVSIVMNGKRALFNLPRKENPLEWEKKMKRKTGDLQEYLNIMRTRINEVQTELMSRGIAVSAARIKEYIQSGGIKTYTLEVLFDEYYKLLRDRIGIDLNPRTYYKYEKARDEFFEFAGKDTEADEITPDMISEYYIKLKKENKLSTAASKMTKVKTVFKYGFQSGKIKSFPFNTIRIRKPAIKIEYLTPAEMDRIRHLDTGLDRLDRVRDLFLFQALSGLSYGDMGELGREDIKYHDGTPYIRKERMKTGVEYTTILLDDAVQILEKYDYRLPVLTNQKYNCYLKEIADLCGIDKTLHTHLARKTFATRLLNSGVSLPIVSKMLGHTNVQQTARSYAKVLNETIFQEVKEHIV